MGEFKGIKIISTGGARGSREVSNDEIAVKAATTDQWIRERTGICSRNFCCAEETATGLVMKAARQALEGSGLRPEDIGLCINATMTPEFATPSTACLIQAELGLREDMAAFDLNAACSGFLYALETARGLMYLKDIDYALVTASEKFSDILDFTDYGTAILFGAGAGAVVIGRSDRPFYSLEGSRGSRVIWANGPGPEPTVLHMQGRQVFKFATTTIEASVKRLLQESGLEIGDIDHFVFHQANERIIDFVASRMKLDPEKVHKNISTTGNTSAASIPLLLDDLARQGVFKEGERIMSVGFGGGLTWAGILMEW